MIGGFTFLDKWMIRSEKNNALQKLYVKNFDTGKELELKITDELVINPGISLIQKDRSTNKIRISFDSPKTPGQTYEYDLISYEKNRLSGQNML